MSNVPIYRGELLDKFSPTIFPNLTPQDEAILGDERWTWDETPKQERSTSGYSREHIWAHRREWQRLGSGSEGEAFTYNGTVIKVYKTARFPFRNCVPESQYGIRWPTEIAASLILGGMAQTDSTSEDMDFLPVTDYFISPETEDEPPRWHFLTPLLRSGSLVKLASHLRRSKHTYTARELDIIFRPSMERLLNTLNRTHVQHSLCHDDVKLDNVFLSGSRALDDVESLDEAKSWVLADLGNIRQLDHAYHSSMLWNQGDNNNLPDCRENDVWRLVKTYMQFLRAAVDDVATFDDQFFHSIQPWAQLFWKTADIIDRTEFISASSIRQLSEKLEASCFGCGDTSSRYRGPADSWNPIARLLFSREQSLAWATKSTLRMSSGDHVARNLGMSAVLGVPVEPCRVEV